LNLGDLCTMFGGKAMLLPKKVAPKRCSTVVGSYLTSTLDKAGKTCNGETF
jgi:hypothetical protein